MRFHNKNLVRPTVAAFHNSMTFAFTEVIGRSYGGGVLELEPNEADTIPLPPLQGTNVMLETLDRLSRSNQMTEILDLTDQVYLKHGMGLAMADIDALRGIWEKLSLRRTSRTFKRRMKLPKQQRGRPMARLAPMPPIAIDQEELAAFGARWAALNKRLSRTPPQSSGQLGALFDRAVGVALAAMLGQIPIASPNPNA